jgi:excisionase family DNA binding protein
MLSPNQLAKLLGVCKGTAYRWLAEGRIPHLRIGSTLRIRREDLDAFLSSCQRGSLSTVPNNGAQQDTK